MLVKSVQFLFTFPPSTVVLAITNMIQFVHLIVNVEECAQSTHNGSKENAICTNTMRSFIWSCNLATEVDTITDSIISAAKRFLF